ncbi:MAG: 6,7-dimethyl-8-ribityllumazine synthase [Proteobacteria bacterium]|nr:6,7-dimethyl-8-ribityllumazine synthase [Burkholderiales bacterium]
MTATRSLDLTEFDPCLDGAGLRIGIVRGRFNEDVGAVEQSACLAELERLGVRAAQIVLGTVPGALEIPLALQKLAQTRRFDALIALGAVIRGDTYHFEVVSNEACAGLSSVSLETGVPIANGILTTDTDEQAQSRAQEKGRDCARAAVEMANLLRQIDDATP